MVRSQFCTHAPLIAWAFSSLACSPGSLGTGETDAGEDLAAVDTPGLPELATIDDWGDCEAEHWCEVVASVDHLVLGNVVEVVPKGEPLLLSIDPPAVLASASSCRSVGTVAAAITVAVDDDFVGDLSGETITFFVGASAVYRWRWKPGEPVLQPGAGIVVGQPLGAPLHAAPDGKLVLVTNRMFYPDTDGTLVFQADACSEGYLGSPFGLSEIGSTVAECSSASPTRDWVTAELPLSWLHAAICEAGDSAASAGECSRHSDCQATQVCGDDGSCLPSSTP